jgi:divalent metal cation (Fe/Co/Zn/Cd) transporter
MEFLKTWAAIIIAAAVVVTAGFIIAESIRLAFWAFTANHDWIGYIVMAFYVTLILTVLVGPRE